jgi:hypothetical protein
LSRSDRGTLLRSVPGSRSDRPIKKKKKTRGRRTHALYQTKAAFCLVHSVGADRIPLEVHRGHGPLHRSS